MIDKHPPKINHELYALGIPIYYIRAEPVSPNELLYDKDGLAAAIKSNGKIFPIIEGDL